MLGLAGTLSLHGLAIQSFILDSGSHKTRLLELQEVGATQVGSPTAPGGELILVTIVDAPKDDIGLAAQIATLALQLQTPAMVIASPDALLAVDDETSDQAPDNSTPVATAAGDPAVQAFMFGRYTSQISARIERAWTRPRSPVDNLMQTATRDANGVIATRDDTFRCLVQIRQDDRGNVQEVLLLKCNGTEAWRHSLIVAINQSSPLPTPPIPTVFKASLTMAFEAHADPPGGALDQYEFEHRADAQYHLDARPTANSFAPKAVD